MVSPRLGRPRERPRLESGDRRAISIADSSLGSRLRIAGRPGSPLFALLGSCFQEEAGWNAAGCPELGRRRSFRVTVVVSLFRYVLCMIALVPSLTVAAEASWGGWQSGGAGWRSAVAIIPYYGCYSYGYPYYGAAAAVIRLTGGYGYVPNYNYGLRVPERLRPPWTPSPLCRDSRCSAGAHPLVCPRRLLIGVARTMGSIVASENGAGGTRWFRIGQECMDADDGSSFAISS